MNNQSLILLAIGVFVALIVTVAAVDQYLLDEHPPTEVDGLISRIKSEMTIDELRKLASTLSEANDIPESDWNKLIKKDLIKYLVNIVTQ